MRRLGWAPIVGPVAKEAIGPASRTFTLALLDLDAPAALEMLALLRNVVAVGAPIVAIISRRTPARTIQRALRRGADDYCRRPLSADSLAVRVKAVTRLCEGARQAKLQAATMENVAEVGARIAAARGLGSALQALHAGAETITGSQMGVIRLLEERAGDGPQRLRAYRRVGGQFFWEEEQLLPGSNTARVVATGQSVYARDLAAEAAAGNAFARYGLDQYGVRSSLNVPLRTGGQIIGTLHVDSQRVAAFQEDHLGPLQLLADHAAGAVARARVVTELRRQYGEAERTRSQLLAILDASVEGMALVSTDGRLVMVNRRLGEFFDIAPDELLGLRLQETTENPAGSELRRVITQDSRLGAATTLDDETGAFLAEQHWPQRRELAVVCTAVRAAIGDGTPAGLLGWLYVLRDVTREREVDRMKTEFVALASHELRTPLTSIKGYTDLLVADEVGPVTAEQRAFLGIIKSNADRLVTLINDLLDVARLDEGRLELHQTSLDLEHVITEVIQALQPLFEAKRQRLYLDLAGLSRPVFADYGRATQILMNLIANANKYTPTGGQITVRATEQDGWVAVAVRDTGIGLSAEEQARLFTRFYRAKYGASEQAGGTGLGLSIARSLVELHGGTISVDSVPGQGSTFTFTIPTASPE